VQPIQVEFDGQLRRRAEIGLQPAQPPAEQQPMQLGAAGPPAVERDFGHRHAAVSRERRPALEPTGRLETPAAHRRAPIAGARRQLAGGRVQGEAPPAGQGIGQRRSQLLDVERDL